MPYINILTEAARTTWKHKALWVFGLLVALVGAGDFRFSVSYRETINESTVEALPSDHFLFQFMEEPLQYILLLAFIGLVLWFIGQVVGWFSKGALIGMIERIDQNGKTSFADGWEQGSRHGPRLFLLHVLVNLPVYILYIPGLAILMSLIVQLFSDFDGNFEYTSTGAASPEMEQFALTLLGSMACFVPMICCAFLLAVFIQFIGKLAARSLVFEGLGIVDALKRGWHLFWRNFGWVLLTAMMIGVMNFGFVLVASIPGMVLWIPTARAILHNSWTTSVIMSTALFTVYMLVVSVGIGGLLNTYSSVLWTRLYQEWTSGPAGADAQIEIEAVE